MKSMVESWCINNMLCTKQHFHCFFSVASASAPGVHGHASHQAGSSPHPGANGRPASCVEQQLHLWRQQLCHHHRTQHERQIHLPQTSGAVSDHGSDRYEGKLFSAAKLEFNATLVKALYHCYSRLLRPRWVRLVPRCWSDFHQNWCGWRFWNELLHLHDGNEGGTYIRTAQVLIGMGGNHYMINDLAFPLQRSLTSYTMWVTGPWSSLMSWAVVPVPRKALVFATPFVSSSLASRYCPTN